MMVSDETMPKAAPKHDPSPDPEVDAEVAWAAVLKHDARYDSQFLYAVRSTGVFCRPSCPSRRPHRRHVLFFADAARARAAGFRACRRCAPESALAPTAAAMERVRAYIDAHVDDRLTLRDLAGVASLSPSHVQRAFKAAIGLSPRHYVNARRAERFKEEVRQGRSVTDALYEAGYGSGSRLYEGAPARLGMTPGAYKRGGKGVPIRFTTASSAMGRLLVASTERGVCAVQLSDSDTGLEAALRREYPEAELVRDDKALRPALAAILAHLDGDVPRLDLPLDVAATTFTWRVWRALQDIPYGETRSYAEVAAAVGQPKAVRAVARACATNRVALLVPCHRVVRKDGSPGGYRWGEARKRRLLEREKAQVAAGSSQPTLRS
jgi:AraC family transcriptional regulator, regulatory protein of adaptative response / methylated-DNA-[protein]-cysteine methyltransferase